MAKILVALRPVLACNLGEVELPAEELAGARAGHDYASGAACDAVQLLVTGAGAIVVGRQGQIKDLDVLASVPVGRCIPIGRSLLL